MKDRLAFLGFRLITFDECLRAMKGVMKWVLMQPLHEGGSRWCQSTLTGREAKQTGANKGSENWAPEDKRNGVTNDSLLEKSPEHVGKGQLK